MRKPVAIDAGSVRWTAGARPRSEYFEAGLRIRDGLMDIPARLAGTIAGITDEQQLADVLRTEFDRVLSRLADDLLKLSGDSKSGPVATAETPEFRGFGAPVIEFPSRRRNGCESDG